MVMSVDFGVIWAAEIDNVIRFSVRRPSRRPRVTRHPPSHQHSKEMTDDPRTAGGAADLKSNYIIEFSGPNNPKIDTHDHISVISFEFW